MEKIAYTMSQPGHHVLTFRPEDLPDGYGECLDCGARVNREAWMIETCPGRKELAQ